MTIDLAIIGSGPSTVCLLNRLEQRHPSWFSKVKGDSLTFAPSIKIFDTTGCWMGKWNALFANLGIDYLRSPATFHVESTEGDGLLEYAQKNNRMDELIGIPNIHEKKSCKRR